MGRDTPDGVMRIRDGWLDIDWRTRGSTVHFARLRDAMERIVQQWQGRFLDNPLWYLNRVITVHALGGCPMGRHADEGVVDSFGSGIQCPRSRHRRRIGYAWSRRRESEPHDRGVGRAERCSTNRKWPVGISLDDAILSARRIEYRYAPSPRPHHR